MEKLLYGVLDGQAAHTVMEAIICEKVRAIYADLLQQTPDEASGGWFENFKRRTSIHSVVRHGEAASADIKAAKDYLEAEEKRMPDHKPMKDRNTLALCANEHSDMPQNY